MKKILFMVIGFMFATQTAFASPTGDKMNLETLNKSDAQVLFQDSDMTQQVVLLNEGQMNELKAKGWWSRVKRRVSREIRRWGRDTTSELDRFLRRTGLKEVKISYGTYW